MLMDLERSAADKPKIPIVNMDGDNIGMVDNSAVKPNFALPHQGGAGKGTVKDEKEGCTFLRSS